MIVSSGYRKYGFDVSGGAELKKEHMSFWMNLPERTDPRGVCLELAEEVQEVEQGFFELLPTISELRILGKECRIWMDDATEELFHKNDVLIRGEFGSCAEKFAKEQGLRFLHLDTLLARSGDYFEYGVMTIELCFYSDGSCCIHQDEKCQGSSAGSSGGGEMDVSLPKDFYLTMSAKEVAEMCWCTNKIISNGILAGLMAKAKAKKGFLIDYRKSAKKDGKE